MSSGVLIAMVLPPPCLYGTEQAAVLSMSKAPHLHQDCHTRICYQVGLMAALPFKIHPASSCTLAWGVRDGHLHSALVEVSEHSPT